MASTPEQRESVAIRRKRLNAAHKARAKAIRIKPVAPERSGGEAVAILERLAAKEAEVTAAIAELRAQKAAGTIPDGRRRYTVPTGRIVGLSKRRG